MADGKGEVPDVREGMVGAKGVVVRGVELGVELPVAIWWS